MARFKSKSKKSRKAKRSAAKAARVRTVTRKVYVKAKRAKRKFKRVASERMNTKDIVMSVAGAGVGGIGGAFVLSKIPASVPTVASNAGVAALGGLLAAVGVKKRNRLIMGLGLGASAVGVRGLIANFVPTMAGYDDTPALAYSAPAMGTPFAGCMAAPFAGEMAAPFDGDDSV